MQPISAMSSINQTVGARQFYPKLPPLVKNEIIRKITQR